MIGNAHEPCVLVLRESQGAQRTETQLYGRGYTPLCVPLFTYKAYDSPMPESWARSLGMEVLVLTSASALRSESVQRLLHQRPHMPVLAVGDYTAEEARKFGAQAVLSAGGDRHDLLSNLQNDFAPPARLLWVTGRHHKSDFFPRLLALGYEVTLWEVYSMEAVATLPQTVAKALCQGNIRAILHYSRRSSEVLCILTQAAGLLPLLSICRHLCISQDAAEPLLSFGVTSWAVAGSPTEAALFACLGDP